MIHPERSEEYLFRSAETDMLHFVQHESRVLTATSFSMNPVCMAISSGGTINSKF